jgi:hypothetical protein
MVYENPGPGLLYAAARLFCRCNIAVPEHPLLAAAESLARLFRPASYEGGMLQVPLIWWTVLGAFRMPTAVGKLHSELQRVVLMVQVPRAERLAVW